MRGQIDARATGAETAAQARDVAASLPDNPANERVGHLEARRRAEPQIRIDDQVTDLHTLDLEPGKILQLAPGSPDVPAAPPMPQICERMGQRLAAVGNTIGEAPVRAHPLPGYRQPDDGGACNVVQPAISDGTIDRAHDDQLGIEAARRAQLAADRREQTEVERVLGALDRQDRAT